MRRWLVALSSLWVTGALAAPVHLYVAPSGNDAWSGATADRPFASPLRARDELRRRRAAGPLTDGAVVTLRGGTYYLSEPLLFGPADSGTAAAPVVWEAATGEIPVLSGGRRITGWQVVNGRWQVRLPEAADGWSFSQLSVDGQRRLRPRLPRAGYAYVAGSLPPTAASAGKGADQFRYGPGDIDPAWTNREDLEVLCFHVWSVSRLRIASIDSTAHRVTFQTHTWHPSMAGLSAGSRYVVDNVKEALGQPGEWYLDRPTATLTYVPRPGESPADTVVVAPRLEQLVGFQGDVAGRRWVEHLVFRGLTFAHANWVLEPRGRSVPQAENSMAAAVRTEGLRDTVFEDCRITGVGGYGLELGNGTKRCRVERCELTDLGGGGIKLGPSASADDEAVASHNTVRDCLLAHGGRLHPPAVGLWLGYAHHNTIEHNEIADFYYSGVSVGWTWGYGPTPTRDNTISYNHIHDMPQRVLGDQAGIYTLGNAPGSVIRGNVVCDQVGVPWGVGIYLDEGSSEILVEDNLVYGCTTHSFNVNYGRENVARNNIFGPILDPDTPVVRCGRDEAFRSMTLRHNLIVPGVTHVVDRALAPQHALFESNLYGPTAGKPLAFGALDFAGWQQSGQDADGLVADPGFVDPRHGNYDLRPDSPATKVGFKPFDWRQAGRLTHRTVTQPWPAVFAPATPPPPQPVADDFEDVAPGEKSSQAQTYEDGPAATARVTSEQAAGGKQCLKFSDAAGQPNFWNPHVCYTQTYDRGRLDASFDLRLEPGSPFEHAWRDGGNPWHTGPVLAFAADGWLTAGGRKLWQAPPSTWFHVSLTCPLGDGATGKWSLRLEVAGQPALVFDDLNCDREFRKLAWCGFVSVANGPATVYLDNVRLAPRGQ